MSLHIVFSNRIENLKNGLLEQMARCPSDPFDVQHVVVPSAAVTRYLQLAIAKNSGVCANVEFSYLASWLWRLAGTIDNDVPLRSPVDSEMMTWMILRLLEDGRYDACPRLAGFLKEADDMMRFELSRGVARVFDQYATYRPDWLAAWGEGKTIPDFQGRDHRDADEDWQRKIWKDVASELELGDTHPLKKILDKITDPGRSGTMEPLPHSAAVFAVPVIPPLYMDAMRRLSRVMDITLYLINPCREYWFDIVSSKRLARLQSEKRADHQQVGHLLLADWGTSAQSAMDLVYEEAMAANASETFAFAETAGDTLLARLQRSILNMEDLAPGGARMSETDRSIEIHVCHGPVRELEALHDRLLGLFAADDTLRTDDVVVLTPEIDSLACAIDAVFGTAPRSHFIPYTIAGRSTAGASPCFQVLVDLLDLLSSRLPASRVFDLLCRTPVASKFDLDDEGLKRIRGWLACAGIHWGLDGEDRRQAGLAKDDLHTFQRGIDALMLGLALPRPDEPLAGLLPCDSLEGSRAETLGRLWLFIDRLTVWKNRIRTEQPASRWQDILNGLLADFVFCEQSLQNDYDRVVGAIAELSGHWRVAKLSKNISERVVRTALMDTFVRRYGAQPSGSVTFASLAAMRGLAYRVVCLIGMNDDAFPGRDRPFEFDLMPKGKSRRGDRQKRREDRGLFLDAVLAARETLHISYTGRDQRTNAEMPPSVLVSQLADYLVPAIAPDAPTPEDLRAARFRMTVHHPLQPFSRRCFDGSDARLLSYNASYAAALNASAPQTPPDAKEDMDRGEEDDDADSAVPPFFNETLTAGGDPEAKQQSVAMNDLSSFLRNPSRFILKKRLLIDLYRQEDVIADEEPLMMDFSERREMADMLVAVCREKNRVLSRNEALALVQALPQAPPGAACAAGLSEIWPSVSGLAGRLIEATADPPLPPKRVDIPMMVQGQTWQLKAVLGDLRSCGLVRFRCDDLRGYDHLQAWLDHLILCASRPEGVCLQTRHLAFDKDVIFGEIPQAEAAQYLSDLVDLYREGLLRPVPFFRKSAWAYVETDKDASHKLMAAKNKWRGWKGAKGAAENEDIWHALAWRGVEDPMDDAFSEIAQKVLNPILKHRVVADNDLSGESCK